VFFFGALLHKRGKSAGRGPQGEFGKKDLCREFCLGLRQKETMRQRARFIVFFSLLKKSKVFAEKKEVFPPQNLPSIPHAAFAALGHEGHTLASAAQKSS
jgi:hypothetical protein